LKLKNLIKKLLWRTEIDEAKIDAVCESIRDIAIGYKNKTINTSDEINTYFNQFKIELEQLVKIMDHDNSSYAVGKNISIADVLVYCLITVTLNAHKSVVYDIAGQIPKIRNIVISVSSIPAVREWTKQYPV
jgi:glutathione S-transferase